MKHAVLAVLFIAVVASPALGWGKKGHELVNKHAIRCLPADLKAFYEKHEQAIVSKAMEADEAKRKTGAEDIYHFVDLDAFGDPKNYPRSIDEGMKKHGLDAFLKAGLLPWRIRETFEQLVAAWKAKNTEKIVELSAWLGHYAGDAHVPLHATANYDGQLTKQDGLHSRWESELLDLHEWDAAVTPLLGKVTEVADPFEATFAVSLDSLSHVEKVLALDAELTAKEPLLKPGPDGKMPKKRGEAYYKELYEKQHELVEQRIAKSATWAASLWWSAWVKAGKPVP
jgi:hypothetical protein